ncbi:MAG: flagellin [Fibrobacteres bacterium]|nr:flagellin [Fibrobacterota bacterium]
MRINHNISAMIAQGANYRINQSLSQSLDRLSTGLRITKAADDAAGLSVSEEMRTQIIGGQMAERNISDAIAFLRIADGAMEEVGTNLKRMRDLAVQGANDTLTRTERAYMQKEYEALRSEIERITKVTQYNGITLFEKNTTGAQNGLGKYGNAATQIVGNNPFAGIQTISYEEGAVSDDTSGGNIFTFKVGANSTGTRDATDDIYTSNDMLNIALPDMSLTEIFMQTGMSSVLYTRQDAVQFDHQLLEGGAVNNRYTYDGVTAVTRLGSTFYTASESCRNTIMIIDGTGNGVIEGAGSTQVKGLRRVNAIRSYVGAAINRLEHSLGNLRNQNQNTQTAESNIRDADFATESASFTRNQILSQSSTSMVAQANTAPNLVLSLLR